MSKIEGTIVAAGRLESGEQATCGVVVWTTEEQKAEMERCKDKGRVVVERKADHDAREAEVERIRDAERQRVAEGMSAWCSPPDAQAAKAGEVELMTNAARLIREVIGRDLNRRRRFCMYQDQIDDLWKVVDMLEAAAKAGEEPIK